MGTKFSMVNWHEFNGTASAWDNSLQGLDGVTLYQTYAWGEARRQLGWHTLRMVAKNPQQEIVAMVQASVRRAAPSVALCWIPGGFAGELGACGKSFKKSLAERVSEPFIFCRMNALRPSHEKAIELLKNGGWKRSWYSLTTGLSLDYDLRPEEEDRLISASSNWRHNLRRSNKYGLEIQHWEQPNAEEIIEIYRQMESHKGLEQQHSLQEIRSLLASSGNHLVLYRCKDSSGQIIALRGAGIFGARAWDLLAAAAPPARKVYASHALFWALTSECRRLGAQSYDLSGVDPVGNKGVYDFKKGTGAADQQYLGEWEWSNMPGLRYAANLAMRLGKGGV